MLCVLNAISYIFLRTVLLDAGEWKSQDYVNSLNTQNILKYLEEVSVTLHC